MRTLVTAFGRFIALFVTLSMLTSGVAMAAYVCPKTLSGTAMTSMAMTAPAEPLDADMPAHCAERQSGDKQALEQSGNAPVPALPATLLVQQLPPAAAQPHQATRLCTDTPRFHAHAPPFLRTQRIRI